MWQFPDSKNKNSPLSTQFKSTPFFFKDMGNTHTADLRMLPALCNLFMNLERIMVPLLFYAFTSCWFHTLRIYLFWLFRDYLDNLPTFILLKKEKNKTCNQVSSRDYTLQYRKDFPLKQKVHYLRTKMH